MKNTFHINSFIFATISYIIMILINSLANILPINGKGTGEISDSYPNLFAPSGITFAIWGIIYLLLFFYTIFQFYWYHKTNDDHKRILHRINILFSISSIANAVWIFAWHYMLIPLSLILMLIILFCLIQINLILKDATFSTLESLTIRLPFTVYFGWITIATIANITVFLVSIKWNRFSLSEVFWTNLILIIGAMIGAISVLYYKSIAYGIVFIWAYTGIALKHISPAQLDRQYPSVIFSVFFSIFLITITILFLLIFRFFSNKK